MKTTGCYDYSTERFCNRNKADVRKQVRKAGSTEKPT